MDAERLFKELADLGVCASGRRLWRQSSRDEDMIIKVWKRWPEYWVEHSDKALDIVRRYFSSTEDLHRLEDNYIYLDRNTNAEIGSTDVVFIVGDSDMEINVKDWAVVKVYCFNTSKLRISCGFHAYVNIECYDNSRLTVDSNKGCCTVYAYDDSRIDGDLHHVSISRVKAQRGEVFNGKDIL